MVFSVSTFLYRQRRLVRDQLLEISAHGFTAVELYASRMHVDYHNASVIADVQQWLAEARLELTSVHAPITETSLASADHGERETALAEAGKALHIARRIPFRTFTIHLGRPKSEGVTGGTNRDAARRSIDALAALAEPLGVAIAVEVIPNDLSRAASLAQLLDEDIGHDQVGICLDAGHARLEGDVADAVETVSGHLIAVDVHDNRGRGDDHLPPFDGAVDWPSALTTLRKVGYDGALTFELSPRGATKDVLAKARDARRRLEVLMKD
ncbi:MAG TPA: sugar phosphate isomerase/epimerase family protein [Vicinamibacterales bacterium]|nr:sugar phosphate isomerase/epimerase family protein [Vicinamibacterales bacterium]